MQITKDRIVFDNEYRRRYGFYCIQNPVVVAVYIYTENADFACQTMVNQKSVNVLGCNKGFNRRYVVQNVDWIGTNMRNIRS